MTQKKSASEQVEVEAGYMLLIKREHGVVVFRPGSLVHRDLLASGVLVTYHPITAALIERDCTVPNGMVVCYKYRNASAVYMPGHKIDQIDHLIFGKLLINDPDVIDCWNTGKFRIKRQALSRQEENVAHPISKPLSFNEALLLLLLIIVSMVAIVLFDWRGWSEWSAAFLRQY